MPNVICGCYGCSILNSPTVTSFSCLTTQKLKLEFQEPDVSLGKTKVNKDSYPQMKGYFRETCKSQNINPISPTPKFNLGN